MPTEKPTIRPKGVTLDREKHELRVDWGDDHISVFPLNALREACPCVMCRGGHEMMGKEHDPELIVLKPMRSYQVKDAQMIGNYAMQFFWDDGHNSGIYSWGYLNRICPCVECQAKREAEK